MKNLFIIQLKVCTVILKIGISYQLQNEMAISYDG